MTGKAEVKTIKKKLDLEKGTPFIAIGEGPDGYSTSLGRMTSEEVDRVEKEYETVIRIDGDWRGI